MVRDSSSTMPGERVNLAARDWLGISGSVIGVLGVVLATYQSMDRALVELKSDVRNQAEKIVGLQEDVTRLESRLFDGGGNQ
tara:strand:+ start:4180 stop:4425 length:246 start_codon:yes stop_codon:yes gene_type:complete